MSHDFTCHALRNGKSVEIRCEAKSSSVLGIGQGGIMIDLPKLAAITDTEFAGIVAYWLENTDIVASDPRFWLVERIRKSKLVRGYNGSKSRRLELGA
jgi:hypothetical protein